MENAPFETNMFSSQALIEWCWCPLDAWPDLASLRPKLIQPPPAAQKFTASLFSLSAARSSWSGGDLGFRPTSKNPTACGWEARKFWYNGYQCDGIAFCIEPQSLLGPCSEFSLVNNPSFWYCCVGKFGSGLPHASTVADPLYHPSWEWTPSVKSLRCAARGADLVVAETESEANIIRGTALDAIFELQVNQAGSIGGTWEMTDELKHGETTKR